MPPLALIMSPWFLIAGLSQGHAEGAEGCHDRAEEAARQGLFRIAEGQACNQGMVSLYGQDKLIKNRILAGFDLVSLDL